MIATKITNILTKIQQTRLKFDIKHPVRLVAVSKTKTVEQIQQAYDAGIKHFGQNYAEQIEQKQPKLPLDIKWHFIGHLQSNKIKKILLPNLDYIQTIDRQSLADKLHKQLEKQNRKLKILIQVKSSNEQTKSGISTTEVDNFYCYIRDKCPQLIFKGLMTIGEQGDINAFTIMNQLKTDLCYKYTLDPVEFELSMGMSGDFEQAIEHNSTSVRIGSSIFGERNYNKH